MSATWMRAHELGQPLMLTVIGTSSCALMSSSRFSSSGTSVWLRLRVSAKDSLQNSMPVQAIRLRRQCDGRRRQAERIQAGAQLVELVVGDVEDDQLLIRREPDAIRARRLGEVGDLGQDGARTPGPRSGRRRRR